MKFRYVVFILLVAVIGVSVLPVQQDEQSSFANPAFQRAWSSQSAVAAGQLDLWGGEPLLWRNEPYESNGEFRRTVQYFERGRMEIMQNSSKVTQGLLAQEMLSGEIDLGTDLREEREAPDFAIDGDERISETATYAGLKRANESMGSVLDRTDEFLRDWITPDGSIVTKPGPTSVRLAKHIPETGHNLPDVTVELFSKNQFATSSWVEALGYPISEPFWTIYRRGDTDMPSLVQVFERRILVYTPDLPKDRQFTVNSIGRHYYKWRYGSEAPSNQPTPAMRQTDAPITVPSDYQAGIYAEKIGTPVGLAVGPTGHLWVITAEGDIVTAKSDDPNTLPDDLTIWASDLVNPRGIAVVGDTVYVTTDDGLLELTDSDGNGEADEQRVVRTDLEPLAGVAGAPRIGLDNEIAFLGTDLDRPEQTVLGTSNGETMPLSSVPGINDPGPFMPINGDLFITTDRPENGSELIRVEQSATASSLAMPESIAHFPDNAAITGLAQFDSGGADGQMSILASATIGNRGSIFSIEQSTLNSPLELVEFATGLKQPGAMITGLDGSIYVIDQGRQQIIRISPASGTS